MDPLANAYLKIVNESVADLQNTGVAKTDLKIGAAFGHEDKNAKTFLKKSGPEDSEGSEDVENPKEAEAHLTASKVNDGTPKKLDNSSRNPFDSLYNKIISEEGIMDFSTDTENPEDSTFEPSEDENYDEFGEGEESEEGEEGEEESGDEVSFTLDRETAEKLYDVLGSILGGGSEEGEEEEGEGEEEGEEGGFEFGGSEEGEEEEEGEDESSQEGALPFGEATDIKELSSEKGKTLLKKSNYSVKGAVPVSKKKAVTPATGKGFDGKLKAHSTSGAISKLQSKKQDVGGVKTGKFLFDNE
jgi:hypothetical protein